MKFHNEEVSSIVTIKKLNVLNKTIYFILQHECQTRATRVRHERHECNTSETRVQHKWDTSDTSATQVWHECYKNDTSVTRVRNFDFHHHTSKNIFSQAYISYMANERLQGVEQFHSKNYLPHSHDKMHLKSAPKKLNFVMAKAKSKSYTLDCSCKCSCTFPHSYA